MLIGILIGLFVLVMSYGCASTPPLTAMARIFKSKIGVEVRQKELGSRVWVITNKNKFPIVIKYFWMSKYKEYHIWTKEFQQGEEKEQLILGRSGFRIYTVKGDEMGIIRPEDLHEKEDFQ